MAIKPHVTTPIHCWKSNLTIAAIQHLHTLIPSLPEPQQGALSYGLFIAAYPHLDPEVCKVAGKVVFLTAHFKEKIEEQVALRGEGCHALKWDVDLLPHQGEDLSRRSFTFYVSPEHMNNEIQVKLVRLAKDKIQWQSGHNLHIHMSPLGHMTFVKMQDVSFS